MNRDIRGAFLQRLTSQFPALSRETLESLTSEQLLSPFVIELPAPLLEKIQTFSAAFSDLRRRVIDSKFYSEMEKHPSLIDPGHPAIMMSFDFHVTPDAKDLKLIEVNTNAAFLILSHELYQVHGLTPPVPYTPETFREDILSETRDWANRFGKPVPTQPRVAIVDEKPEEQRMFLEFLVTREWVRRYGWECEIRDVRDVANYQPDFVYNRSTDFYLETETTKDLGRMFREGLACVSPHPFEYFVSADKQRLIDYGSAELLENLGLSAEHARVLLEMMPKCFSVTPDTAEELWGQRKKLFFKPKREFGSKKAFKGASISRKLFDQLVLENQMAQEYVPAPEVQFETPKGPQSFKYDLRCHFYDGRLESVIARLYQGQVTNLRTSYGGFAPVVFR